MPAKRNIAAGGLEAKEELKAVLLADSFAHVSLKLAVDFSAVISSTHCLGLHGQYCLNLHAVHAGVQANHCGAS